MLLFHLSREKIILQGKGFKEELPYLDIERKLPPLLLSLLDTYALTQVRVINGPGSFTTLRLGCLNLMVIKQLGHIPLTLLACSKLDIYAYAIQQGLLPDTGCIYIGQKKNMWVSNYDRTTHTWENNILTYSPDMPDLVFPYFIDPCEHILLGQLASDVLVTRDFDGERLSLRYKKTSLDLTPNDVCLSPVETLEPNYMLDPQIG